MYYLSSLVWDHIERLDKLVATYLGAENSPYASAVGRMFPISMIARVSNPGVNATIQSYSRALKESESLPHVRYWPAVISYFLIVYRMIFLTRMRWITFPESGS
jgi:hypothetical protein